MSLEPVWTAFFDELEKIALSAQETRETNAATARLNAQQLQNMRARKAAASPSPSSRLQLRAANMRNLNPVQLQAVRTRAAQRTHAGNMSNIYGMPPVSYSRKRGPKPGLWLY